ncbi:hypothetical protein LTR50_002683 [Elasticomyces elasticus]|nr:hypothetical protein LTR50_002683 [Elasticomyces elasticus]
MESHVPCANTGSNTLERAHPDAHASLQTSTPRHFPNGTNSKASRAALPFNIFKQGALFCPQMGNLPKFIPVLNRDSHSTEVQGTELDTLAPRRSFCRVEPAVQGTYGRCQRADASGPVLNKAKAKAKSRNAGSVVNTRAAGEALPSDVVLRNSAVQAVQAILGADAEVGPQFVNPWKDKAEDDAKHDNGDEEGKDDNDGDGGDGDDDDDSDDDEDWVHLEEGDGVEPWTAISVRWYGSRQVHS